MRRRNIPKNIHPQPNPTHSSERSEDESNPRAPPMPQPSTSGNSRARPSLPATTAQPIDLSGVSSIRNSAVREMVNTVEEIRQQRPLEDFSPLTEAIQKGDISFAKLPSSSGGLWSSISRPTSLRLQNLLESIRNQTPVDITSASASEIAEFFAYIANQPGRPNSAITAGIRPTAGRSVPGYGNSGVESNRQRHAEPANYEFPFVMPKPPRKLQPKTVAAALAARRNSPANAMSNLIPNNLDNSERTYLKRNSNIRQMDKPFTITQPTQPQQDDDDDDDEVYPVTMCECVTEEPSHQNRNQLPQAIGYNYNRHFSNTYKGTMPPAATTTLPFHPFEQLTSQRHNQHGFPSNLGPVRNEKSPSSGQSSSSYSSIANLQNFVRTVIPDNETRSSSPRGNRSLSISPSPSAINPLPSGLTRNKIVEAYHTDPEVKGDKRKVARKYRVNIRTVEKLIGEAPTKSLPESSSDDEAPSPRK